ncbi:hypothetical protein FDP41_008811 [Naegleria fowleri]|uniref:Uncharacterized protein n=1 Tax=Naegleria fowleri TaxID=5763 RepID=A0A6A5BIT8_NAEFO|nr:uncharacterized protein FDP41_008811 [Naegleria fowleri]KAF0972959.1 hypothetical protein FDP41_008811 [Naegleria fowleri]
MSIQWPFVTANVPTFQQQVTETLDQRPPVEQAPNQHSLIDALVETPSFSNEGETGSFETSSVVALMENYGNIEQCENDELSLFEDDELKQLLFDEQEDWNKELFSSDPETTEETEEDASCITHHAQNQSPFLD